MYSRSYNGEEARVAIPENYDGTAFSKIENEVHTRPIIPTVSEPKFSRGDAFPPLEDKEKKDVPCGECTEEERKKPSFLQRIPFVKSKDGKIEGVRLFDFKMGCEELLIIGVALFLLFSKEGDVECAIMLLLLLFIS